MATLSAFKNLGKSIMADIADAKDAVSESISRARTERAVVRDFKALLREHPGKVAEAFVNIAEGTKPKRTRKAAAK